MSQPIVLWVKMNQFSHDNKDSVKIFLLYLGNIGYKDKGLVFFTHQGKSVGVASF